MAQSQFLADRLEELARRIRLQMQEASRAADVTLSSLDRLEQLAGEISGRNLVTINGHVSGASTAHYEIRGLSRFARLGDIVVVEPETLRILTSVIRIHSDQVVVKPFGNEVSPRLGARAQLRGQVMLRPCTDWLGRVIDPLGEPIDGRGPLRMGRNAVPTGGGPPSALQRQVINEPLRTGVRAIDLFTPLVKGQRVGVFAGSGVGKSTLLGMLASAQGFDAIVIALVGERSREVKDFLSNSIGEAAGKTTTVVATGDSGAMLRRLAPESAMRIAECFRDEGQSVLLIVDSITRYAHASREAAMAAGEPPVARGYTPSVFADLARLLERAGPGVEGAGAITGVFSVLVDGDNHNEPISDAVRGILDGHIVLERAIAERGRLPAFDPLKSLSRLSDRVWSHQQHELLRVLRTMVGRYEETRDLRTLGGYTAGQDPELDKAISIVPKLYELLVQSKPDLTTDIYSKVADLLRH